MSKRTVVPAATRELSYYKPQYKKGFIRPYFSSLRPYYKLVIDKNEWMILNFLVVLATSIILYLFEIPAKLVVPEYRFIRSINNAVLNQFSLDLYPPLVKLIFAHLTKALGYNGQFVGSLYADYPKDFPYQLLRLASAVQGIATVAVTYFILRTSGCRAGTAFCGAAVLVLDKSFILSSRFFSIDPFYIMGISVVTFLMGRLSQLQIVTKAWFKVLYLLGLALGTLVITKYAGFLTLGWVLAVQLKRAWLVAGDLGIGNKKRNLLAYLVLSILFVVTIPVAIFFGVNVINLRLVSKVNSLWSDQGYSLMSSTFQGNLLGNGFGLNASTFESNIPLNVLYGSKVTIRHVESLGGYLHSHNLDYPKGSREQQVTLYNYRDPNNEWIIEYNRPTDDATLFETKKYVSEQEFIRFRHVLTGKYLHVNDLRGPMSEQDYDFEVSAKNRTGYKGQSGDNWKITVARDIPFVIDNNPLDKIIHPLVSGFRLYNRGQQCSLLSHDLTLPEWGANQQEVICVKDASLTRSVFYIEENYHPLLEKDQQLPKVILHKQHIIEKVLEYVISVYKLAVAYKIHIGEHPQEVEPMRFLTAANPVDYFIGSGKRVVFSCQRLIQSVGLALVGFHLAYYLLALVVNLKFVAKVLFTNEKLEAPKKVVIRLSQARYDSIIIDYVLGFGLHFFPLLWVGRTFLASNYLASHYFLVLIIGQAFELVVSKSRYGYILVGVFLGAEFVDFWASTTLTYGL